MDRSRGGLTKRIHSLVDAIGRPILLKLTGGQAHERRSAADMFESLGAGQTLLADRAYDSDGLRDSLADRGAIANIRLMPTRKRLPAFDAHFYKQRIRVERFFSKLKHLRAFATRSDKHEITSSPTCNSHHSASSCEYI